jgi:hypothetical protein
MRETVKKRRERQKKSRIFILGTAFLLIIILTVGIFTYRNYPNDRQGIVDSGYLSDSGKIMENPDDTFPQKPVGVEGETAKLSTIYIPQTKSLLFNSKDNNFENIQAGKIYYQDENGRLESAVNRDKDGVREELTGYDNKGNIVDKMEIGYICDSARHLKCAIIFKNKISIYETKTSGDNENEEIVTEYLILPQMKFIKGKTYTKL